MAEAGECVFVSYSREDSDRVDLLQHMLEAAGISVWRDTVDLWPGEDWKVNTRRAIMDNALVFLACFSKQSTNRRKGYQNEELILAIENMRLRSHGDTWLIPIRFDECKIPNWDIGAGRTLDAIQRVDLFGDELQNASVRLVAAIQRILSRQHTASLEIQKLGTADAQQRSMRPAPASASESIPLLREFELTHGIETLVWQPRGDMLAIGY